MKKFLKDKSKLILSVLIVALMCLPSMAADPGSDEDPLISLSYVNDVLMPQMKSYVDSKLSAPPAGDTLPQAESAQYELVNAKKGQTIIGAQSTEFILRMGSADIVATSKGGVADVSSGVDLANGTPMPANHLLIIPFDDWRGVKMTSDGILMIKGKYSIN